MSRNKSNPLADKRKTGTRVKREGIQSVKSMRRNGINTKRARVINKQTSMISIIGCIIC